MFWDTVSIHKCTVLIFISSLYDSWQTAVHFVLCLNLQPLDGNAVIYANTDPIVLTAKKRKLFFPDFMHFYVFLYYDSIK